MSVQSSHPGARARAPVVLRGHANRRGPAATTDGPVSTRSLGTRRAGLKTHLLTEFCHVDGLGAVLLGRHVVWVRGG